MPQSSKKDFIKQLRSKNEYAYYISIVNESFIYPDATPHLSHNAYDRNDTSSFLLKTLSKYYSNNSSRLSNLEIQKNFSDKKFTAFIDIEIIRLFLSKHADNLSYLQHLINHYINCIDTMFEAKQGGKELSSVFHDAYSNALDFIFKNISFPTKYSETFSQFLKTYLIERNKLFYEIDDYFFRSRHNDETIEKDSKAISDLFEVGIKSNEHLDKIKLTRYNDIKIIEGVKFIEVHTRSPETMFSHNKDLINKDISKKYTFLRPLVKSFMNAVNIPANKVIQQHEATQSNFFAPVLSYNSQVVQSQEVIQTHQVAPSIEISNQNTVYAPVLRYSTLVNTRKNKPTQEEISCLINPQINTNQEQDNFNIKVPDWIPRRKINQAHNTIQSQTDLQVKSPKALPRENVNEEFKPDPLPATIDLTRQSRRKPGGC